MMSNKVSIIVPIYNASKYLVECVNSLINQDYSNLEILLINDGSTDGSAEICDSLQNSDKRIRVIHKENGGTASARNLGVQEASGEYVMFIDADDWFELDTVSTLVSHMDSNSLDVARFNYVREFEGKSLAKENTFLEARVYEGEECKKVCRQILGLVGSELAHPENINFLSSVCFNIYRKSIIIENDLRFFNFAELGSFVDGTFNFTLFAKIKRFEFIDRHFYHYRKTNASSASSKYRANYVSKQMVLFEKLRNVIDKNDAWDEMQEAYCTRVVYNTMEMCFNAVVNKDKFIVKYREVKGLFKNATIKDARKKFKLKCLTLKWKVYFLFIKWGWTLPVYLMSATIKRLKARGV